MELLGYRKFSSLFHRHFQTCFFSFNSFVDIGLNDFFQRGYFPKTGEPNLARRLHKAIRRGQVELTVVSRDNFHTFHGFIGEMLTGKIQLGQITSPARRIFPPAHFHNAEIEKIIAVTDVAAKMEGLGLEHTPNTPAQFADFTRNELAKWAKIVKDGNIKVE